MKKLILVILLVATFGCNTIDNLTSENKEATVTEINHEPSRHFWGKIKNTGDADLENVQIVINLYNNKKEYVATITEMCKDSVLEKGEVTEFSIYFYIDSYEIVEGQYDFKAVYR